jgi:hypothetical protein
VSVLIVSAEISGVIFVSSWFRSRLADQIVPALCVRNAVDQILKSAYVSERLDPGLDIGLHRPNSLATLAQQDPLGFLNLSFKLPSSLPLASPSRKIAR